MWFSSRRDFVISDDEIERREEEKRWEGRGFVWSEDDVCDRFDFDKKWAKVEEERKKIKERRKGMRGRGGQRERDGVRGNQT